MTDSNQKAFNGLPNDNEVIARARALLHDACENTDSYHALRLGLARRRALNAGPARAAARMWLPLSAGAVACCLLAVGIVSMRSVAPVAPPTRAATSTPTPAAHADAADDLAEVASSRMEMMQDLDFYRWLASQPTGASARGGVR